MGLRIHRGTETQGKEMVRLRCGWVLGDREDGGVTKTHGEVRERTPTGNEEDGLNLGFMSLEWMTVKHPDGNVWKEVAGLGKEVQGL